MKTGTYAWVFGVLVISTIIEIGLINLNLARSSIFNGIILLTLLKILLIASFYMHMRYEWRQTLIFTLPAFALIIALTIGILIG